MHGRFTTKLEWFRSAPPNAWFVKTLAVQRMNREADKDAEDLESIE
jgi:hypothetical protein